MSNADIAKKKAGTSSGPKVRAIVLKSFKPRTSPPTMLLLIGVYVREGPTDKVLALRNRAILRLCDGKIIEQRELSDYLTMFQ